MVVQRLRGGLRTHLARSFLPSAPIERREVRIARHLLLNLGDVQRIRQMQGLRIDVGAADDENFRIIATGRDGVRQGMRDQATCKLQSAVARDHHRGAPRQRLADGVEGLASHDQVMPHGQRLEMFQVFRAAPGQGVIHTDGAVLRHGDDERQGFWILDFGFGSGGHGYSD